MDHTAGRHLEMTTPLDDTWRWAIQTDITRKPKYVFLIQESEMGCATGDGPHRQTTPGEDHTAGYQLGMDHTAGQHLEMGHSDGQHLEAEMGHAIGDGPHHQTTTGDDHTTAHQMGMDHTAGRHLKRTTRPDDTWRCRWTYPGILLGASQL
nr:hypothetical protein BaRGS_025973 [Batillaria attramentaria]